MISKELQASILRYFYVEKWAVGTIRRHLHIHASTIQRVLRQEGVPAQKIFTRSSLIDPFLPFITETLLKFPTLTSARLYNMIYARGYRGCNQRYFRHLIAMHRPRRMAEAYLRLKTLPGEQGQVDWGHFGHIQIGRARRPVIAFVMVLSFSRKIFLRFYLNQRMSAFLKGHEEAFKAFNGVPRVLLFDNLKSCVLERMGEAIHFNPTFLSFSSHYRFEARPVAVARGNEKGRVERAIRYIRDNFFAGREWKTLAELNQQADLWCEGIAADRPCPEDLSRCVRDVFEEEKPLLFPLPDNPYPTEEREEVRIGKTPYARFDGNDYSVPHSYVRRTLTVLATEDQVRILEGTQLLATHLRSYDKGHQMEDPEHIQRLIDFKKKAQQHGNQHRLINSVPSSAELLKQAAAKGYSLISITRQLMLLLDSYGALELEGAVADALIANVPHPTAVRINLDRRRESRQLSTAVHLNLSANKKIVMQTVNPHALSTYDEITKE